MTMQIFSWLWTCFGTVRKAGINLECRTKAPLMALYTHFVVLYNLYWIFIVIVTPKNHLFPSGRARMRGEPSCPSKGKDVRWAEREQQPRIWILCVLCLAAEVGSTNLTRCRTTR